MAAAIPAGLRQIFCDSIYIRTYDNTSFRDIDGCYFRLCTCPQGNVFVIIDAPPGLSIITHHNFQTSTGASPWHVRLVPCPGAGLGLLVSLPRDARLTIRRDRPTPPDARFPLHPHIVVNPGSFAGMAVAAPPPPPPSFQQAPIPPQAQGHLYAATYAPGPGQQAPLPAHVLQAMQLQAIRQQQAMRQLQAMRQQALQQQAPPQNHQVFQGVGRNQEAGDPDEEGEEGSGDAEESDTPGDLDYEGDDSNSATNDSDASAETQIKTEEDSD